MNNEKYEQLMNLLTSDLTKEEILEMVVNDKNIGIKRLQRRDVFEKMFQNISIGIMSGKYDDIIDDNIEIYNIYNESIIE